MTTSKKKTRIRKRGPSKKKPFVRVCLRLSIKAYEVLEFIGSKGKKAGDEVSRILIRRYGKEAESWSKEKLESSATPEESHAPEENPLWHQGR